MKHSIKSLLAVLVVSLSLATPVLAGPYEDAVSAYFRKDYATAMRLMRPLAEQGNVRTQIIIGLMYKEGEGVPQDYAEARKWFRKAAEQGFAEAQYWLGATYDSGTSERPHDYTEAVKWFSKAAEQGFSRAQHKIGSMYWFGYGVSQNYVEALKWLNLAADQGNEYAAKARDKLSPRMTPDQITEAQRLAREWKKQVEAEKAKREAEAKQKALRQAAAKKKAAEEAAKRKADLDRRQQELAELEKKQTEDREHLARERDKMAQRLKALEEAVKTRAEVINEKKQKLAALQLPDQQPKPQAAVTPLLDAHTMTLVLQHELKRVGCDPGKVDGKWGNQGINALTKFNKYAKLKLPTDTPTMDALEAVKRNKERVCPLVCGPQFNINGDQCVKKACRAGQLLTSGGQCIKVPVKKPKAPSVAKKKASPKNTKHQICLEKFGVSACKDTSPE